MADLTAVSITELNSIIRGIQKLHENDDAIYQEVQDVISKQDTLDSKLGTLMDDFNEYVRKDAMHKSLSLAETRIISLRQELEEKYGFYQEVRRMSVGILQGVDNGLISDDTLKFTTEEVMIKAAGYWLAPALVCLAAWIRKDKDISIKALNESLKRNDYKTTIFFMLVMRRLGREEASAKWLERYFLHQDPNELDREFILILEAVANGIFAPAARKIMMDNVKQFLAILSKNQNFIDDQRTNWLNHFKALKPTPDSSKFPLMEKNILNFNEYWNSYSFASVYQIQLDLFTDIIAAGKDNSLLLKVQLDEVLTRLVTNFDDEELPLRKKMRLNELIIDKNGDENSANALMKSEEKVFDEKVNFLQMLTNASFNPEKTGTTKTTQVLAVSICKPWIINAHETFSAGNRMSFPNEFEIKIEKWSGKTKDGGNEKELKASMESHYNKLLADELKTVEITTGTYLIYGLFAALSIFIAATSYTVIGVILLAIVGVLFFVSYDNVKKKKDKLVNYYNDLKAYSNKLLSGVIAEIVDFLSEYKKEDSKSESVHNLLNSINIENYSSISKDVARNIIS